MNEEETKIELEEEIDLSGAMNIDRLGELEKELEEVRQHVLYAQAETQNVRRRLEQEKITATQYAATAFARDMLSVKDNLERALSAIPEELRGDERMKGLIAGIEATGREVDSAFQRHGIARVEAIGKPLDPHLHQAMMEVPVGRGARHHRPGDAGGLHDQGPAASAGLGWGGEEGLASGSIG